MNMGMYKATSMRAVATRLLALTPGGAPTTPINNGTVRDHLLAEFARIDSGRLWVCSHHARIFSATGFLEAFPGVPGVEGVDHPPIAKDQIPDVTALFTQYCMAIPRGKRSPARLQESRTAYVDSLLRIAGMSVSDDAQCYPTMWLGAAAALRFDRARLHTTQPANLAFVDLRWIASPFFQVAFLERPRFFADADLRGAIASVDSRLLLETAGANLSAITWID